MKILLTNDDGYDSPGILALFDALSIEHEVVIAAPDRERSGCSHSITLISPVQFKQRSDKVFSCSGTPADCVLYSHLGAVDFKPDLILSGINRGPNLGTDLLYSGTAAAARQGALSHIPSIAFSCARHSAPWQFQAEAQLIALKLDWLVGLWRPRTIINVNFPMEMNSDNEWVEAFPGERHYNDQLQITTAADGSRYFFLAGQPMGERAQAGSDWEAVLQGKIAWSRVKVDPVSERE